MTEEDKVRPAREPFNFSAKINELWTGKMPLFQGFWMYYFSALVVLKVLGDVSGFFSAIFGIMELVWAGFMVKPIFIAADQYKGDKSVALAAKAAVIGLGLLALLDAYGKIF